MTGFIGPIHRFGCADCGLKHYEYFAGSTPWMLRDELWEQVAPEEHICLCQPCVSARLGRPLVATDFRMGVPL